MAYTIHVLGTQPYEVKDKEEAIWHLGAKYGAGVYNQAFRQGLIAWNDDHVKVTPFEVEKIKTVFVDGKEKKEYVFKRL
jgi:hypothetical protein